MENHKPLPVTRSNRKKVVVAWLIRWVGKWYWSGGWGWSLTPLGGRELCSAFFARQGRAPPARCIFQWVGVREQSYIAKCHILRNDLKTGPLKIAEFLHAAMNWWENKIILLTLFKIYTLCWPNTPFLGAKSGKNAFFRKKYPITLFLLGIRRSVWWGRWKGTIR